MDQTIKVQPAVKTVLQASSGASGPGAQDCLMQLTQVHRLRDSEARYNDHRHNLMMKVMRDREGLGVPLRLNMELHMARQIGRLPCLKSSHLMEDILLGRDTVIDFEDILGAPENYEAENNHHMVVAKSMGIM